LSDVILDFLIFGTIQGSVYALLAIGFSLVYGVGGILNQAHGAFYVITMYIFYWFYINFAGFGLLVGMIVGIIVCTIVGGLIYLLLIKPIKDSHVGVVIVTFAFAFFIEQFVKVAVDSIYHDMPPLIPGSIEIFGVIVYNHYILVVIASLSVIILVILFINKSKI